jgi:hypothetical protein
MRLPCRLISKVRFPRIGQAGDQGGRQSAAAQIAERRLVQHVVGMIGRSRSRKFGRVLDKRVANQSLPICVQKPFRALWRALSSTDRRPLPGESDPVPCPALSTSTAAAICGAFCWR